MKCVFCGKENAGEAVFCRFCGRKNTVEKPLSAVKSGGVSHRNSRPAAFVCPSCGKENLKTAKFCRYCGSRTTAEPAKDLKAGAPESVPAGVKCTYCGSSLPGSAKICNFCGGMIPDDHREPQVKSRTVSRSGTPAGELRQPAAVSPFPQDPSPKNGMQVPAYRGGAAAERKKNRSAGKTLLFLLTAAALVFAFIKISDFFGSDNGGNTRISGPDGMLAITEIVFDPSDYNVRGDTAEVSEVYKTVSAGGVTVDFSGIPISGEHILEVKKLPQKNDAENGMIVNAYDLSLGDISEFDSLVRITFPYTAKENEYSFIQAYNENTRSWELLPSDTDKANTAITFATGHFSTFAEIVQINGPDLTDTASVFDYPGGYQNPLSKVCLVEEKLHAKLNAMDPSAVQKLLEYGEFPTADGITATLALINDLTNVSGTPGGSAALLKLFSQGTLNKMGPAFLAIGATATITRCVYQWNQGDTAWNIIKDNGVNLAELGLTAAGLAYGSPVLLAGAAGIWAAGMIYENLPTPEYDSVVEKAYHQFNRDHLCFVTDLGRFVPYGEYYTGDSDEKYFIHTAVDGKYDYEVIFHDLEKTYLTKKKDPERLAGIITDMVDTYCDSFWQIDGTKRMLYIDSVNEKEPHINETADKRVLSLYEKDWSYTAEQITAYKENMKNSMIAEMQPYLERVIWNLIYQIRKDLIDRIRTDLEPWLNRTISVEITDPSLKKDETFDQSAMAAYEMRFIYNSEIRITDPENRNFRVREKSNKVFEMTVFNYIKAGFPREVGFFEKGSDKPVLTASFEYNEPVINVILDNPDYSGIYTGTSYGQPLTGGEKFELAYKAVRIKETETGLLAGPCLENGDYESELQVPCTYNAETGRYEGTVLLEDGSQWTELIFSVSFRYDGNKPKAEVAYIQHFSGRRSMGYAYDVTRTLPLSGTAISRQEAYASAGTEAPSSYGKPVGGF